MSLDVIGIIIENEHRNRAIQEYSASEVPTGRLRIRGTNVHPVIGRVSSVQKLLGGAAITISENGDRNARLVR